MCSRRGRQTDRERESVLTQARDMILIAPRSNDYSTHSECRCLYSKCCYDPTGTRSFARVPVAVCIILYSYALLYVARNEIALVQYYVWSHDKCHVIPTVRGIPPPQPNAFCVYVKEDIGYPLFFCYSRGGGGGLMVSVCFTGC